MAMPDHTSGEEDIIQGFLAPLAAGYAGAFGLKDDCAVVAPRPRHEFVLKTDAIAAGVHFLPHDRPEDIGWKALAVNVSDLAAKGALPVGYLLSLAFPEAPARAWMAGFAAGLREAQEAFGMHLMGGDTDRRPGPVAITPMVIGEVPHGCMVRRGTAEVGDVLYVSGTLGDSALGLRIRRAGGPTPPPGLTEAEAGHLVARYLRPEPRLGLRRALLTHGRAAMDISDGLAKDLDRMCRASGVGASVEATRLPLSAAARAMLAADPACIDAVVAGGDDYEVLAAVPPAEAAAFEQAAANGGVPVTAVGTCVAGASVAIAGPDGRPMALAHTGWDHF